MMSETNIKKMEELLTNDVFITKLETASSYEEIHQLIVENGVDVAFDDFVAYNEECRKAVTIPQNEELDEDMLESVAGGMNPLYWMAVACGGAVVIGRFVYKIIAGRLVRVV